MVSTSVFMAAKSSKVSAGGLRVWFVMQSSAYDVSYHDWQGEPQTSRCVVSVTPWSSFNEALPRPGLARPGLARYRGRAEMASVGAGPEQPVQLQSIRLCICRLSLIVWWLLISLPVIVSWLTSSLHNATSSLCPRPICQTTERIITLCPPARPSVRSSD